MRPSVERVRRSCFTGEVGRWRLRKGWPPIRRWEDEVLSRGTSDLAIGSDPDDDKVFLFVCGLHRSGTTFVTDQLSAHPDISGFSDTGAIEDEGQFLQTVYPIARKYGGPGLFGFSEQMHLTERAPLVNDANRRRLFTQWSRHWNLSAPVLVEKSPPNLLKMRFLQAMFPNSRFLVVLRHPIAVSLATKKGSHTSRVSLLEHWLESHDKMLCDLRHINNVIILRYEDIVREGAGAFKAVYRFLNIAPCRANIEPRQGLNEAYFRQWNDWLRSPWRVGYQRRLTRRFEERIARFGYSMSEPYVSEHWDARKIENAT